VKPRRAVVWGIPSAKPLPTGWYALEPALAGFLRFAPPTRHKTLSLGYSALRGCTILTPTQVTTTMDPSQT